MKTIISNTVIKDIGINDAAFRLYCILAMLAGNTSRQVCVSINELAEITGKSNITVRRNISTLIEKGIIERILQKSKCNRDWSMPSIFIIHNCTKNKDNKEA